MNSYTFNNLVQSVQKSSFDDDKVDAIKTTVQAARAIASFQMIELLKFISFGDSKLEAAKVGYRYCIDPANYSSIVGEAFSFSDEKEELNQFIRQHPRY